MTMFRARQAASGFGVSTDSTNRRRYIRLPQVLPVEMRPLDAAAAPAGTALWQGFTRNISFDGACVEINHLDESTQTALRNGRQRVQVFINIPFPPQQITAVARIAWLQPTAVPHPQSCVLGIHYESIDPRQQRRLIRAARFMRRFPRVMAAALLALAGLLAYAQLQNYILISGTRQTLRELTEATVYYGKTLAALNKAHAERQLLEDLLQKSSDEQRRLAYEIDELNRQMQATVPVSAVEALQREKEALEGQLIALRSEQSRVEERRHQQEVIEQSLSARADDWKKEKNRAAAQSTPLLLAWLYSQQNPATGLIQSFDGDATLADVGFTYDQALCAMTFVNQGEYARAARIFAFFRNRASRQDGNFFNAYDIKSGAVAEYAVHTGPAIYLALAILAYEEASRDTGFTLLAIDIGERLLALQAKNAGGALTGGPELSWVSTEHNIAGYALFSRLAQHTGQQKYHDGRYRIAEWLRAQGVNRRLRRLNRGEQDSMIATDVMALGMLAFTPVELESLELTVDDLVACVEENCKTQIWQPGKNGKRIAVEGYDFSCPSSVGRRGTIAVEWTAQMITVYRRLAEYYRGAGKQARAEFFQRRAEYYLNEIDKLLLVREDAGGQTVRVGLPYATDTGVDTGHGWFTPDSAAISAAGTSFAILAKQGYNIFNTGLGDTHPAKDGI